MFDNKESRSPIKPNENPLRNPAESLEDELTRLFDEEIYPYVFVIMIAICFVGYEWYRWFFNPPPQPIAMMLVAVLLIAYSIYKVFKFRSQVHSLKQGIQGEKAVGQYLEDLRKQNCLVFHDIPGEGFNIDHVIVSNRGIYTVETKTLSKPLKGNPKIDFDGERILVDGFELDRNPVPQGLAERDWLQKFLVKTTGRNFTVKAVIVFPGWWVERQKSKKDEIWILNHQALSSFIKNEPAIITDEDVALISYRISDYVRDYDKKFQH